MIIAFQAKEWGDKTLVSSQGSIFGDSQTVINIPLKTFFKRTMNMIANNIPIQNAFPDLSEDEREFLISGVPVGEFDKLFKEEE